MKQVNLTINVSDSKFNQLIDFLSKNFGTVNVTYAADFEVPEWHKEIVLERMKNAKAEDFFSIDELDNKIKL
jgi:hypothetical protein